MMRYLLLAIFLCGPLQAAFEDFPRLTQRNLFAADDPYSAEPSRPADPDDDDEEEPEPGFESFADTGMFGLGIWGTPYLRFTGGPFGIAAGIGVELSIHFSQAFALTIGAGVWSNYVDARENGQYVEVDAGGLEVELGFRWRFLRWDGGALYTDARAVYAVFDGPGPVRATSSIGGGGHFGIEIGSPMFRVYFECGLEYRAALNYSNVGWLYTGDTNGEGGFFFDLLRVGLRVYL